MIASNSNALEPEQILALVFDLYGTVVDMQSGLTKAVTPFLREKGWGGSAHRFVTWWRRMHFENSMIDSLCECGHTSYRVIGERAVSVVMERCGFAYTRDEAGWLVGLIESLKPFPDVVAALKVLRVGGYRLAILSNGDRDMLESARPHLGFDFDRIMSVDAAGYFKPHWKTYSLVAEDLRLAPERCLFVANHVFDCVGAKAFGMRSAFVDRRKRPFGETPHQPDLVVENFAELARVLT